MTLITFGSSYRLPGLVVTEMTDITFDTSCAGAFLKLRVHTISERSYAAVTYSYGLPDRKSYATNGTSAIRVSLVDICMAHCMQCSIGRAVAHRAPAVDTCCEKRDSVLHSRTTKHHPSP